MIGHVTRDDEPHWVYEFRNAEGIVLYVGCTLDVPRRLREHERSKSWLAEVVDVQMRAYPDRWTAEATEAARIRELAPVYERSSISRAMRRQQVAS